MVHQTSMVHSVNGTSLVPMVKDNDELTVWSDRPWNKYDACLNTKRVETPLAY